MKKLNITKEQFNKSQYFQKKYGKLEFVSESGKLFKTSKGKVLMFKEGKLNSDFDDDLDDDYYDGGHLDADEDNPKFSIGDKVIWNDSLWKVVDCWYDSIEGSNLYDLKGLDTREETSDVPGDELCAYDGGIAYESNRKFGRKFAKESVGHGRGSSVGITCKIALKGDSPEEVLQNLHEKLLNLDAAITDGNENSNPEIVEKYNYWDKENEGDTMFPLYKDDDTYCEIYNARTYSSGI